MGVFSLGSIGEFQRPDWWQLAVKCSNYFPCYHLPISCIGLFGSPLVGIHIPMSFALLSDLPLLNDHSICLCFIVPWLEIGIHSLCITAADRMSPPALPALFCR